MKKLFHSVVVCTKDRQDDIKNFLYSLISQVRLPEELLIIDASEHEKDIEAVVRNIVSEKIPSIKYYKTKPHLAYQKNFAISKLDDRSKAVSFFDDDVILDSKYINVIMKVLEYPNRADIAGVTGKIANAKKVSIKVIKKIFFLYSLQKGKILKSGCNVRNLDKLNTSVFIEWMPGGMSTYRRYVFNDFKFDEYYSRNGAGIEDIDFSFKVAKRYKFLFVPQAILEHRETNISRIAEERFGYIQVMERYYFIKNNMNTFTNRSVFIWSIFGIILINLFSACKEPKIFRSRIKRLFGNALGLRYCFFGR